MGSVDDRSTGMLKQHVLEERDPDLEEEECIKILESRGAHWKDVAEDNY